MGKLSNLLWLVPLSIHGAYMLATFFHMPPEIGSFDGAPGTSTPLFYTWWLAIVIAFNATFIYLNIRLPQLPRRMLSVPNQDFWHGTPDRKNELVERLRGICDTTLLCLNVFFLAVYQSIYQSNAQQPFLSVSTISLIFFFMVIPLLIIVVFMIFTVKGLASQAQTRD